MIPVISLVTDRSRWGGAWMDRIPEQVAVAAQSGVSLIQVREPGLEGAELYELVRRCVGAVRGTLARVVVNERLDVAVAAGAIVPGKPAESPLVARITSTDPDTGQSGNPPAQRQPLQYQAQRAADRVRDGAFADRSDELDQLLETASQYNDSYQAELKRTRELQDSLLTEQLNSLQSSAIDAAQLPNIQRISIYRAAGSNLVEAQQGRDDPFAVAQALDPGLCTVMLVHHLADELLDEVFQRDDAGRAPVLVHDDGHLQAARPQIVEQRIQFQAEIAFAAFLQGFGEAQVMSWYTIAVRAGTPAVAPVGAAKNLLSVISNLQPRDNGSFLDWQGKAIPW